METIQVSKSALCEAFFTSLVAEDFMQVIKDLDQQFSDLDLAMQALIYFFEVVKSSLDDQEIDIESPDVPDTVREILASYYRSYIPPQISGKIYDLINAIQDLPYQPLKEGTDDTETKTDA